MIRACQSQIVRHRVLSVTKRISEKEATEDETFRDLVCICILCFFGCSCHFLRCSTWTSLRCCVFVRV